MEWLLVAVPVVALVLLFGPSRYYEPASDAYVDRDEPDDGDAAGVREPRRPLPQHGPDARAAVDPRADRDDYAA
jgi:hypothetical protein